MAPHFKPEYLQMHAHTHTPRFRGSCQHMFSLPTFAQGRKPARAAQPAKEAPTIYLRDRSLLFDNRDKAALGDQARTISHDDYSLERARQAELLRSVDLAAFVRFSLKSPDTRP